jgi:hypothetical protein
MPGPGAYAAIRQTFRGDARLIHIRADLDAETLVEMANAVFGPDPRLLFLNASYEIRAGALAHDHLEGATFDDDEEDLLLIAAACVFGRFTETSVAYQVFDGGDRAMSDRLDRLTALLPDPPPMGAGIVSAVPVGALRTQTALVIVQHDDGREAARLYRRPEIARDLLAGAAKTAHAAFRRSCPR